MRYRVYIEMRNANAKDFGHYTVEAEEPAQASSEAMKLAVAHYPEYNEFEVFYTEAAEMMREKFDEL